MKSLLLSSLLLGSLFFAQQVPTQPSVERSVTGVQIGFLGASVYNESRLSEAIALRSSALLNAAFWFGDSVNSGFILAPALSLEPKYYYNLERRVKKGKSIKNNSGNFISLDFNYTPNWFVISSEDHLEILPSIGVIPSYGLRRSFAQNFNYEFKVGFGYGFLLNSPFEANSGTMANLSFKVGYDF